MNNQLIIHISAELIIIGTVSYYFNKKVNSLKSEVDELKKRCADYENKLDKVYRNMDVLYNMINDLKRSNQHQDQDIQTNNELRQRRPTQRGMPPVQQPIKPTPVQQPAKAPVQQSRPPQKQQDPTLNLSKMFLGNGVENFLGISLSSSDDNERDVPEVSELQEESEAEEEYDEEDLDAELSDELKDILPEKKSKK
jgi:hypothetical protein